MKAVIGILLLLSGGILEPAFIISQVGAVPPIPGEVGSFIVKPATSTEWKSTDSPIPPYTTSDSEMGHYHFLGAMTPQENEGVMVEICVTDPSVQRGTWDFFATWVMEHQYGPDLWIQVGWAEVGWRNDRQYIFVYDTQYNEWFFFDEFPISPGDRITVALYSGGGTVWSAWLWDHLEGGWTLLHSADVGFSSPEYTSQFSEIYCDEGSEFYVPDTSFFNSNLLIEGSWSLWDTRYTTIEYNEDPPYAVHWFGEYWDWQVYTHGPIVPTISVYTDKYAYSTDDTMNLGLDITNSGPALQVCLGIWIEKPGGGVKIILHVHDTTLLGGTDYSNPTFKIFTVPTVPSGVYTWHAALLDPATHTIRVHDTAEWEFS